MAKRRGQSAAFMARIRKMRGKKKTVTKRKPVKAKSTIKRRNYKTMAKRKAVTRRRRTTKKPMSGVIQTGLGVGAYILFESMIEPKIIAMANITNPLIVNAVELGAGIWASRKAGVIGQVGKAAIVINLYQLLAPYLSNIGNGNAQASGLFS